MFHNLFSYFVEEILNMSMYDESAGKSGHGSHAAWLDFGSPLMKKNKGEILENIFNWPPLAECLDPPHEVAPLAELRMSGSATDSN